MQLPIILLEGQLRLLGWKISDLVIGDSFIHGLPIYEIAPNIYCTQYNIDDEAFNPLQLVEYRLFIVFGTHRNSEGTKWFNSIKISGDLLIDIEATKSIIDEFIKDLKSR